MKFRVTIRGEGVELRGVVQDEHVMALAEAMKPFGLVIASPMEED